MATQVTLNSGSIDSAGSLALKTNGTTTAVTIDTSQNLTMVGKTTNPTTISVGNATPSASGAGITFPATQSASSNANTLDDYEEGTWTAALGGTWTSNPTGLGGHYTKVGRFVTAYLEFNNGTKSSSVSGYFTGLPFNTDIYGTGSATDSNVTNNGLSLAANSNRIWLTGTSFGSTNYVVVTYMTST